MTDLFSRAGRDSGVIALNIKARLRRYRGLRG
jgi:hypothetical protein